MLDTILVGHEALMSSYPEDGGSTGAFATADLGPVNLRWQLEEGVIAQMSAPENNHVLIRLAGLLKSVQEGAGVRACPPQATDPGHAGQQLRW